MVRSLRLVVSALIVLVAFLLIAVVACDDEGEGEVTPTPTSTPTSVPTPTAIPPEVKDQLQRLVLQLEDLPSGVVAAEELFVTNEESAAGSDDPEGRLAMLEEWGRILGYDVTYQANPEVMQQVGLLLVNSTASLYDSEEGAIASFADAVQTARTTDWAALFGGAQEVEVEELTSPGWVDEMLWLRIAAKGEVGEQPQEETLANEVVIFRQGRARAYLSVAWVMGRASIDFVEQLTEAQAQRLKDALP